MIQGFPDRLSSWEESFTVPVQYSAVVMAALLSGHIIGKVRNQISQDVATKMLSYCKYPSKEQYETVALKLVEAFPVLKDTLPPGHVSSVKNIITMHKFMHNISQS